MKKRLLSILLIGCILLMLLPAAVFAEDTATAVTEVATPDALTAALADDTVAAIQLTSDINISAPLTIRRTVTLDLNGHVLKMTGSGSVFLIEGNDAKNYFGKLTLTDSNPEAVHKFTPNDAGLWVLNETDGTQTVTGGVITGGTGTSYTSSIIFGGGVHIRGGEFTMTGGNIVGCTASGGGVYVHEPDSKASSTFTLAGGSIVGCTASFGGGVFVNNGGASSDTKTSKFIFTSGSIRDCSADDNSSALDLRSIMHANGGTVDGTVWVSDRLAKLTSSSSTGTNFKGDVFNASSSTISGGTFEGKVTNKGSITGGTFNGEVTNSGTITGGSFNGKITGTPALATGSGTAADPYRISTAEGLKWFRDVVNGANGQTQNTGACAVLENDIVLNDGTFDENGNYTVGGSGKEAETWTPIGYSYKKTDIDNFQGSPYTGTFDGQGHTIKGLYVDIEADKVYCAPTGLFGFAKNATIRNLTVTGLVLGMHWESGGIAGTVEGGSIENCGNRCDVNGATDYNRIGGIAGDIDSTSVSGCYNTGKISGTGYLGGIIGTTRGAASVCDCYNIGSVTGNLTTGYTGGIVGINGTGRGPMPELSNCYNIGTVTGYGGVGGIVDYNEGIVKNCYFLNSAADRIIATNHTESGASVDGASGPKSAEEFADGTVLAALIAGRDSDAHPWNSACRYLTAAGRTLPVFKGQGDAHTHDWSKWTSNGDGTHTHRCACGVSETVSCSGGTATCTKPATCTVCGTKYGNVLGHVFSEWKYDTDKHWKECLRCTAKSEEALHVWDSGTVTKVPTCTNEGQTRYTCSICHTTKDETILASGHSPAAGWTSDAAHHWHVCNNDNCNEKVGYAEHSGGTATCTERAVCDVCGTVYGDLDAANHGDLQYVPAKPATIAEEGNIEYWYCAACGKYYKDAGLTEEITAADTVLARIPYFGYSTRTIRASAGTGGSITPSGSVSVRTGHDQTFTITPDKGYAIADVKVDGRSVGAVRGYTFQNISSAHTIEVSFVPASTFADVPAGSYYEEAVSWAVANGITAGTGASRFSPDGACTRAQAVTFLWRAAGSPAPKTSVMPFADVPANSYFHDAVLWAVENGITTGTSAAAFSPDDICTRAQIASFLYRLVQSEGGGFTGAWMFLLPFSDTPGWAYEAIAWCYQKNITSGTTATTFSPDAPCTRAQIVTFLWRCKK